MTGQLLISVSATAILFLLTFGQHCALQDRGLTGLELWIRTGFRAFVVTVLIVAAIVIAYDY